MLVDQPRNSRGGVTRREPAITHLSPGSRLVGVQMHAHCPRCPRWFLVADPSQLANFLCPVCLTSPDDVQRRRPSAVDSSPSTPASSSHRGA